MRSKVTIAINEKFCKRCGICIEFCPQKVFEPAKDGLPLVVNNNCTNCTLCDLRCPEMAITLEVEESE
ncbi:ferredoxin family protein [Metallumcola ferriviriculae]|uniref:Ferredoxin family protein n=1 Tax=Metallumcola ferriviriculae TaxID=3039180 RepID=A0AAU0UR57_9FIRM|nr:ferredoxin family protein [Desulfitibacteraceae bacterium MK1]